MMGMAKNQPGSPSAKQHAAHQKKQPEQRRGASLLLFQILFEPDPHGFGRAEFQRLHLLLHFIFKFRVVHKSHF
jgi:hypothetical protein